MAIVEVRAEQLDGLLHRAEWQGFSFHSDEPAQIGGGGEHPIPLAYFTASVGFCALTQIVRFAKQMRVPIDGLEGRVVSNWGREGSVLAGTVLARCVGFEIDVDVTSTAPPEHVAAVVQNAHAGCFAEQALRQAVAPTTTATVNGRPFRVDDPAPPGSGEPEAPVRHFPIAVDLVHTSGVAHVARWEGFTFASDEPPHLDGQNAHPIPIAYFVGSVGFCTLTQLVRYAEHLNIPLISAECRATSHFGREGSVLQGTVAARLDQFDVHVDLESDAPSEQIATLLQTAHAGCYAHQALAAAIDVGSRVTMNGRPLDYASYPRWIARN